MITQWAFANIGIYDVYQCWSVETWVLFCAPRSYDLSKLASTMYSDDSPLTNEMNGVAKAFDSRPWKWTMQTFEFSGPELSFISNPLRIKRYYSSGLNFWIKVHSESIFIKGDAEFDHNLYQAISLTCHITFELPNIKQGARRDFSSWH